MRFINMYLVGYFVLLIGALAALWYGGVLRHVSPVWIIIGLVIAVGLGIMLSVTGGKPPLLKSKRRKADGGATRTFVLRLPSFVSQLARHVEAPHHVRALTARLAIALLIFGSLTFLGACKEEGTVRVSRLKFNGVHAVKVSQLRSVLATLRSSRLPWGTKHYFQRQ